MSDREAAVVPVDKPVGPTSHDVVAAARRALGTRRIGHTGTLDPFASGLLLLCVGAATRLSEYLTGLPKTYVAEARLGVVTETDDLTGQVLSETERWRELAAPAIEAAFRAQEGVRLQRPPAYSAKKVSGKRAYDRARRGEAVVLEPVPVTIYRLVVLEVAPPLVRFEMECSSGTYVRAVARDAGEALGVGAHLTALRRTRIGVHDVAAALPLDALGDAARVARAQMTPLEALVHLPRAEIAVQDAAAFMNGRAVAAPPGAPDGVVVVSNQDRLLGIAESGAGVVRPRKVLPRG